MGVGLLEVDLRQFLATASLATLSQILNDNGMECIELEFLTNWWTTESLRRRSDDSRRFLLAAAEALGARAIKAAPSLEGGLLDLDLFAHEFRQLGMEASEHGTTIALEFMAFTNVPTLKAALDLLTATDHPAVGLEIDVWHVDRCRTTMDELSEVPLSAIMGVELGDGLHQEKGDPYRDTVDNRLLPGRGEFNLTEFITVIRGIGWDGPWGVEILSSDHRARDLGEALADTAATTVSVLAAAEREKGPSA